jgi:hypothetical protein
MSSLYPESSRCTSPARRLQREHPRQHGMFADKSPPEAIRDLTYAGGMYDPQSNAGFHNVRR